ncbi:MAG: PcfJ domain-containing protein, partial [Clostridia bacterium]
RQCNTKARNGYGGSLRVIPCDEQFHEAIRGTSFERMWKLLRPDVGRYTYADRAPEMEAIARRPFLEYLWRMGQKTLAVQGLERHYAAGIINSRGKTATAVLKMTGEDLREVRDKKIKLTEALLVARKRLADAGIHWRMGDIAELNRAVGVILLEDMLEYRQDDKAMRYVLKMARRGEHPSDIRDYWKALHELGQDVRDDALALTNRLTDRHQEAMTQLNALTAQRIANRQATGLDLNNGEVTALGEQFQKALPGLIKRFSYAACGLILRPASGAAELMVESSALNHCVRIYAERYMRGETVICVLRRERAPDVPWHTVEFTPEGKRVQCRGENNQTQVVDAALLASFWAAYGDREERRSAL